MAGKIRKSKDYVNGNGVDDYYSNDHNHNYDENERKMSELKSSYFDIINTIGEDATRQGLLKTPERAAKALLEFTKGYQLTPYGMRMKVFGIFASNLILFII